MRPWKDGDRFMVTWTDEGNGYGSPPMFVDLRESDFERRVLALRYARLGLQDWRLTANAPKREG